MRPATTSTRRAARPLAALLLAVLSAVACERDASRDLPPFPPPPPPTPAAVARADFVGSEACSGCHADEYRAWSGSTHGRAGGAPGPDVVIAPFGRPGAPGQPIRFADAVVTPRIRGEVYEFVVAQEGLDEVAFAVSGVVGGAHMLGGGTQGFLTRRPDGTDRLLPWDWSGTAGRWFCNTGSRANTGWTPIGAEMRLADCGDWPPARPIGTVQRFTNCQECHGSQITTTLEPGEGFRTEYTTLAVNCESCHGPGRRHVELASGDGFGAGDDIGLESLAYLDKEASLEVCFRCHALKDVLREGYLPGESFEAYYALKFPVLGTQPYKPDGRVASFAYQGNHLASACYLQGPMDCVSCHEPHAQSYWDTDRRPLADPFDDGQCTSCHPSKASEPEAHTFHPADSDGSRCVSCHMPYLQHPEVGDGVPFARSDHTIALPRPAFDAGLGITSACAGCHTDRPAEQLEAEVSTRWGALKPHRPLVSGLLAEPRATVLAEAAGLLLRPEEIDPLTQFQALARLLERHLPPDGEALPEGLIEQLLALSTAGDLDVRALALAALHWTAGDVPAVRERLLAALAATRDDAALRGRWLVALAFLADRARLEGDLDRSGIAYRKAIELAPADPRILRGLGVLHTSAGDWSAAIESFRASLRAERNQPMGWVALGIVLSASGDAQAGADAFREAIAVNPHEGIAHYHLGNHLARSGDLTGAAESYERAVAAEPGMAPAHLELARSYRALGRADDALPHARRAVEFQPGHAPARQLLTELLRETGNQVGR